MHIRAFRALRYEPAVAGDVGACISPPYDVIDTQQERRLCELSPYNIVRIIKGRCEGDKGEAENGYRRAAELFNEWQEEGVLRPEPKERIYGYVQNFEVSGQEYERIGLIALGKLADFGRGVWPHEHTLDAPKADRLKLTEATEAQFGQIYVLYDDAANVAEQVIGRAMAADALVDFVDEQNVRHRLFSVDDSRDIEAVYSMMLDREVLIADGHHRYETAVNYYRRTGKESAAYAMMTFVNMRSTGLVVLPTHRLVAGLRDFDAARLIEQLRDDFEVLEFSFATDEQKRRARDKMFAYMAEQFGRGGKAFGIYAAGGAFYAAVLRDTKAMDALAGHSKAWRSLDVAVLHKLVLERLLGIGEAELAGEKNIEYIKDVGDAIEQSVGRVDSGEKQAAFFLNPTTVRQVRAVAEAGERMPQKSTFFFPKVFTGLTVYKL